MPLKVNDKDYTLIFWLSLLALVGMGALLSFRSCATPAHAEDKTQEAALALAKVCVNEAGFLAPADCAAIYQTFVNLRGRQPGDIIEAAEAHSGRVMGVREASCDVEGSANTTCRGNVVWSRELEWNNNVPPSWNEPVPFRPERWERMRQFAMRLVTGAERRRPCMGTPITWGGPQLDDWVLRERNRRRAERGHPPLQILACDGTYNHFVGHPPRADR